MMNTDVKEKIERYIRRTRLNPKDTMAYQIKFTEIVWLAHATEKLPIDAVCLAFNYGMAKGYRAAKAEVRKE